MAAAAIPLAVAGIGALSNWLLNRKPQQTTQTQETNKEFSQRTTPQYDSFTEALRDYMGRTLMGKFESPFESTGYQAQGLSNINQGQDNANRLLEQLLSQYGLRRTGAGVSARMGSNLNFLNQKASFLNNIPLLSEEYRRNNLQMLLNYFQNLPVGSMSQGTETARTSGVASSPSVSPIGAAAAGGANILAGMYGAGAFSKQPTTSQQANPINISIPNPTFPTIRYPGSYDPSNRTRTA